MHDHRITGLQAHFTDVSRDMIFGLHMAHGFFAAMDGKNREAMSLTQTQFNWRLTNNR